MEQVSDTQIAANSFEEDSRAKERGFLQVLRHVQGILKRSFEEGNGSQMFIGEKVELDYRSSV